MLTFLIIEPASNLDWLSLKEIIRKGVLFRNLGIAHALIAIAFTLLVVIHYYVISMDRELGWAMATTIIIGFCIPYLVYYNFDEQSLESLANNHDDQDERQAELGIDHYMWELKDKTEPWLLSITCFFIIGLSHMLQENVFIFALSR